MKKYILFSNIFIFLCTIGCSTSKEAIEKQYTIAKSPTKTEIIQMETGFISPIYRSNDSWEFAYELTLINHHRIDMNLRRIEVVNADSPDIIFWTIEGFDLINALSSPGIRNPTNPTYLKPSQLTIVNIASKLGDKTPPNALFHRLVFEIENNDGKKSEMTFEGAITFLNHSEPPVLGLPFKKGKWFYMADSHQNSRYLTQGKPSYAQRFAIDWAFIEDDGTFVKGDPSNNENYPTYQIELLAVADGVVKDLLDGIPENSPDADDYAVKISRETASGNYILLDIGENINAVYAHLIPSSLRVRVGDRVKKGDVIGLLGNSGNSEGPHLHFHLETDSPQVIGGEGIPFYLEKFKRIKNYPFVDIGNLFLGDKLDLSNPLNTIETNAFPTGNGILEFE